jgi:hypothetical protein
MDRSNVNPYTKIAIDTLSSDRPTHESIQHRAKRMMLDPTQWPKGLRSEWDEGRLSRREAVTRALGRELRNALDEQATTATVEGPIYTRLVTLDASKHVLNDFMRYAVEDADWQEVARHFVPEDVPEEA